MRCCGALTQGHNECNILQRAWGKAEQESESRAGLASHSLPPRQLPSSSEASLPGTGWVLRHRTGQNAAWGLCSLFPDRSAGGSSIAPWKPCVPHHRCSDLEHLSGFLSSLGPSAVMLESWWEPWALPSPVSQLPACGGNQEAET